jgi:CPA2 family monovalent cation:H+ antiporter-2
MGIAADFVLIVVSGFLGALLARALRLPLLVGYVAAGVVVGPYTGGPTVVQVHDIELLAEIGAALLLFSLGLEVSLGDLQPVRRVALIGGSIQVVLTLVAGALTGVYLFGMPAKESAWFGAMIALSSTMVVVKTLAAGGVTSTLASRVMIGILVVQDLSVIPMLIILPQLNTPDDILPKLAQSIGLAVLLLGLVVLLGTRLLPRLLRRILEWGSQELFLVAVVATGVGVGYAAYAVGLSFALGAFVAGIILSESEFSHQALSDLAPLRDIFGLIFFVTVGMLFDPSFAMKNPGSIASGVVLIILGKAVILGLIARAFGYVNMAPWIVGLGLAQIGEFSFVIARSGISSGSISKTTYDLALTCSVLTMAVSPLVSAAAEAGGGDGSGGSGAELSRGPRDCGRVWAERAGGGAGAAGGRHSGSDCGVQPSVVPGPDGRRLPRHLGRHYERGDSTCGERGEGPGAAADDSRSEYDPSGS